MRLFATAIALVALVAMAAPAKADLVLTLDDLSTPGIDVIVVNDSAIGTGTTKGASTALDGFPGAGTVMYSGSVGSFIVTVTTGISKPNIGTSTLARMDLNNVSVSGSSGTLQMTLTDTDFALDIPKVGTWANMYLAIGGVTDGSVWGDGTHDLGNKEFAIGSGGPTWTLGTPTFTDGPFSWNGKTMVELANPFSLSQTLNIRHENAGDITSVDFEISVPEPTSLALLGLGALGFLARRRRKQA